MPVHQIALQALPLTFVRFLKKDTAGIRPQKKLRKDGKFQSLSQWLLSSNKQASGLTQDQKEGSF